MTDQTPDPWKTVFMRTAGTCVPGMWVYPADEVSEALAAERARNQQEIKRLKMMGLPQRVADLMTADAHADEDIIKGLSAELAQRDETIRQLQDAFARCQEVQQATAETWRIEHDQMAEQIARLSAQVEQMARKADDTAAYEAWQIALAENATLRAERDAAQQQIATLTQERDTLATRLALQVGDASELAMLGNMIEQWTRADAVQHGERWDSRALKAKRANELIHRVNAALEAAEARCAALTEAIEKALGFHQVTHTHAILSAALQSTRPQEQP